MLHPKQNRIDYGSQLIPPAEGYILERAFGTTYSLDLEALMVLPVALIYSQPLDGDPSSLRYDMLDAITKAADKITIFCQKAQIKVPQRFHYLVAYWEKGIREIQMPSYVQSFHPKVWVVKYSHASLPSIYRILVTSRNMTFARDWDVAFSSEGMVSEEINKSNAPLIDFLRALNKTAQSEIPEHFILELQKVKFDKDLGKFNKLKFHPIGIPDNTGKLYPNPVSKAKWWDEVLIISPFVDHITLKSIATTSGKKKYLLSRKEELDSIDSTLLAQFSCFQFSKAIELSELNEDLNESEIEGVIQNLHAKLFITQIDDKVYWFLGSANCTDPAQGRNIEFLVELRAQSLTGIRVKDIFNLMTSGDKTEDIKLFEPYDHTKRVDVSEKKNIELAIRKIKHDLSQSNLSGSVSAIENGTAYNLSISLEASQLEIPDGYDVKLKPVNEENRKPVSIQGKQLNIFEDFKGYPETRLSPFVEFEIWHEGTRFSSFLLMMEIDLPSSRLNKIFSSIIDSRDKFLRYLAFLLTGEEVSIIDPGNNLKSNSGLSSTTTLFEQFPVFEKLLIAASRYPEKITSVDLLINRLKDEAEEGNETVINEEFEEFWSVFRKYLKSIEHG